VPPLLQVRNLSIESAAASGVLPAVRDVSLHVQAPAVVFQISHRIGVMYRGSLVELGRAVEVFQRPAHPYTRGLLNSVPTLRTPRSKPLQAIEGTVPALAAQRPGCALEPRCPSRISSCATELPPVEVVPGHLARCPVVAPEGR